MKSNRLPSGGILYGQEYNALRSDAVAASFLHAHQQLGALALGTNPTNGQTITFVVNGSNVILTGKTGTLTNPGDFAIQASAAATDAVIYAALTNPTTTTSTFIGFTGATAANAILIQYLGWGYAAGGTTITPYSLNTSTYAPLTSFTASTTVTSGSWTAQTMELYVEPGTYYVGTTRTIFLGGSTPAFTAPVSDPRIDIVTADSTGTIAITQGSENASPVAPTYPANKVVLCEVYNVVGETAIYDVDNQQSGQGYISADVRMVLQPVYIGSASQVATQLFIPWISSPAQGDIAYFNGSAWARLAAGTSGQFLKTNGSSANPSWGAITVGEADGTQGNQSLTATTSPQTDDLVITHGLGRTPAYIRLSCQITAVGNPSSSSASAQIDMTYNGSGSAVNGFSILTFPNVSTYSSSLFAFGGPASPYTVASTGVTAAATVTVSVTSISSTQFTIHITYQVTTGSGTLSCGVNNIAWSVIG